MQVKTRKAFTLVELLVVIGIIALLISILLPALNRAREQAKMVQCLSNMRQLGTAFLMYNQQWKGKFPAAGVDVQPDDWIYWQPTRDLKNSAIAPYLTMGGRVTPAHFTCPSDEVLTHLSGYHFSYSVNWHICDYVNRSANKPTFNIAQCRAPSDKILLIDEDSDTIDDGCWAPEHFFTDGHNLLSNRHDKRRETSKDPHAGKGNALFCDGHAAFIERFDTIQRYRYDPLYANPANDYTR